jgi:hypothetical protein
MELNVISMAEDKKMSCRRVFYLSILILSIMVVTGCEKPVAMDDVVHHFKLEGMEVTKPDYGGLNAKSGDIESVMKEAPGFAKVKPEMRTVDIDGVLTTIHHFEKPGDAKDFYKEFKSRPDPTKFLPAKFQEMVGKPHILINKNIVLRMSEGMGGKEDSDTIIKIRDVFSSM